MHNTVKNLLDIQDNIKNYLNKLNINNNPKVVAVSKTFEINKILPLIEYGHIDFGENKVQEAIEKWTDIKKNNSQVKLHMIGKLQTNKVKFAVQIFDYIHSVDSEKLAKKIYEEQNKAGKKIKIFSILNVFETAIILGWLFIFNSSKRSLTLFLMFNKFLTVLCI